MELGRLDSREFGFPYYGFYVLEVSLDGRFLMMGFGVKVRGLVSMNMGGAEMGLAKLDRRRRHGRSGPPCPPTEVRRGFRSTSGGRGRRRVGGGDEERDVANQKKRRKREGEGSRERGKGVEKGEADGETPVIPSQPL